MAWIKRNLALVISGLIALGLLGFGGWYLWSAIQKNAQSDGEINQTKSEIERLLNMDPSPNASNLANAKRELDRLTMFTAAAKKHFPATPPPATPLNNESFKGLLQTTINDLHRRATSVGIKVDPDYYFTFSAHRGSLEFDRDILLPLSERLHEVQFLANILFQSRINRLEGIRRAVVPGEKLNPPNAGPTGNDYLSTPPRNNSETGMSLWPYEVTFQCFTPELGAALESLERAPYGFVVKSITSEPAPEIREFVAPAPPRQTNPVPTLVTVVNEKLLRVTVRLEVIKPEPKSNPNRPPPPPRQP